MNSIQHVPHRQPNPVKLTWTFTWPGRTHCTAFQGVAYKVFRGEPTTKGRWYAQKRLVGAVSWEDLATCRDIHSAKAACVDHATELRTSV